MNFLKLTAFASLSFVLIAGLGSCERDEEMQKSTRYTKSDIPATGAQIRPNNSPSTGTGKLTASYDTRDKILNYTITWTGLSDSVIAIRLNGPAPINFNAVNLQFTGANPTAPATSPYLTYQANVTSSATRALFPASGSYSGSVLVDEVKLKELDVINGNLYVTVHTKTILPIASPGNLLYRWFGEIRAQVSFD